MRKIIFISSLLLLGFIPLSSKAATFNPFPDLASKSTLVELDGDYKYVAYTGEGSFAVVRVFDKNNAITASFRPFGSKYYNGLVADASQFIAVGQKKSPNTIIKIFSLKGEELKAFVSNFTNIDSIKVSGDNILVTSKNETREFTLDGVEIKKIIDENNTLQTQTDKDNQTEESIVQRIEVDLTKQELVAYEGEVEIMRSKISSGVWKYPTPKGTFTVLKKIPIKDYVWSYGVNHKDNYNLPGVKHNLMFKYPFYLHGAYWHNNFGNRMSHGCVNLPLDFAEKLYNWANEGAVVHIYDSATVVTKK